MKSTKAALPLLLLALLGTPLFGAADADRKASRPDNTPPPGYVALFNGQDLTGWKGLLKEPNDNPSKRAA